MTLTSQGLSTEKSEGRVQAAAPEVAMLTNAGWWTTALQPRQWGSAFGAMVRSKYRYGIAFIELLENIRKVDQGWGTRR